MPWIAGGWARPGAWAGVWPGVWPGVWLRAGLTGALCLYTAIGAFRPIGVLEFPRPWPEIVRSIAASDRPGAPVLLVPALVELPLGYYRDRQAVDLDLHPLPASFLEGPDGLPDFIGRPVSAAEIPAIRALAEEAGTVWLVLRRADLYDPEGLVAATLEAAGFQRSVVIDSDGRGRWIMLMRFQRTD
ncbi:MAG: hypothetical protein AAGD12_00220 [Pseudomonadota bacterium]